MKSIKKYDFNLDISEFLLRSINYSKNKKKESATKTLLDLEEIQIYDIDEKINYINLKENNKYLIIKMILEHKIIIFIYPGVENISDNNINSFLENLNLKKLKLIPILKNSSKLINFFIKNNKPILGNKFKLILNKKDNYLEAVINVSKTIILKKVLNLVFKSQTDIKIYIGITIETSKKDNNNEKLSVFLDLIILKI